MSHGVSSFLCACYPGDKGTQSWRKWCSTEARRVAGVAVVSCHLGCFSRRDLINWKEYGAEGDRKATGSLGQKGWRCGVTAWQKAEEAVLEGCRVGKPRKGRNHMSFKGS